MAPSGTSDADRQAAGVHAVDDSMSTGAGGLKCGQQHLTCTVQVVANCGDGSASNCVKVTVAYPYRDHSLMPSIPGFGFLLPKNISYSSMAQVG